MENQLVTKLGMSETFSLFGKSGNMERLEKVKLHTGCQLIAYGGAGYIGYEGMEYVIYDENMNAVRVYRGDISDTDKVEDWETEAYFSPYHKVDELTRHISEKFGIGFYYTDERIEDDVIAKSIRHADKINERKKQIE